MSADLLVPLFMRWLHILAAVVAVGGTLYVRFILMPVAVKTLSQDDHVKLRENLTAKWRMVIHACILLFLVSGFYNYLVVTAPQHSGQPLYHALFGIKFLLALAVFALAIMVTSSRSVGQRLRANGKTWLGLLAALALAIILISGVMKTLPPSGEAASTAQTEAGETLR